MCLTDKHTVLLNESIKNYQTKIENPEIIKVEVKSNYLIIRAKNPINLMKKMKKKRSTRTRVMVRKDNNLETMLITVRIHDCIRGKV